MPSAKQDCDSRRLPDDFVDMFTISQEGNQSDAEEDQAGGETNKPSAAKYRSRRAKPWQQGTKPGRASRRKPSKPSETEESSSESSSTTFGSSSSSSSSASSNSTDSEGEIHQVLLPSSPTKRNYGVTHFNSHHKEAALRILNAKGSHLVPITPEVSDQTSTVLDRSSEADVSEMLEDTREIDELAEDDTPNTPVNEAEITIDRPPVPPGKCDI